MASDSPIEVRDLMIAYGEFVVQRDLSFTVGRGDVFVVMGASGCGKTTLLRSMTGLMEPAAGDVFYDGEPFWGVESERSWPLKTLRGCGTAADLEWTDA